MILIRPQPEKGICFAWLPVQTPEGKVWLEHVHYEWIDSGFGGWRYERMIPQDRYDRGERVRYETPPDPKRYCKNFRTDGPTPCHYPHCKYRDADGVTERCGVNRIAFGEL